MASPYFYFPTLAKQVDEFILDENSSRHIVQVLRMKSGEKLSLTDGKGLSALATINEPNKKRCIVNITEKKIQEICSHDLNHFSVNEVMKKFHKFDKKEKLRTRQ